MRERLLMLDGLRGVAALAVFLQHFRGRPDWLVSQGALAVDFFFILSGFVQSHAYQERLKQPGTAPRFLRDRVIRLHPLLLLSLVPGAIMITSITGPSRDPAPLLTFFASMLPFPALWMHPLPVMAFPYNQPSWSLFWELAANLLFVLVAPRLGTRTLAATLAIAESAKTAIPR